MNGRANFIAPLLASAASWSIPATAQEIAADAAATPAAEIVVTAARGREEDVQSTPLAVTALPARILQERFVTDLSQVGKLAPNLQISKNVSASDVAAIYLRGFGTFGADLATEPKVAVFVDGIYQPATIGTVLDTFDVQQIEVQAGPQGTLLGKNAPIGAIYVTSERPSGKFDATVQADYSTLDAYSVRGKIQFPIVTNAEGDSVLSGRVSAIHKGGGNWIYNRSSDHKDFGGSEDYAGRASLRFTPSDRLTWDVSAYYLASRGPQGGNRNVSDAPAVLGDRNTVAQPASALCSLFGPDCGVTPYGETNAAYTRKPRGDYFQVSSNLSYKFDPLTATIVAGHVQYKRRDNEDVDGTPASVIDARDDNRQNYDQQSMEVRLNSNKAGGLDMNGVFDWVVGAYFSTLSYYAENKLAIFSPDPTLGFGAPGPTNILQAQTGANKSQAVFAQVIVNATGKLSGTFGVRQSWDQKSHRFSPPSNYGQWYDSGRLTSSNKSFEAGVAYKFTSSKMAYFRFAQGYATGGFVGFPQSPTGFGTYQPETNDAYELGIKTEWFDRRLRFNVNLFRNELQDLQVAGTLPAPPPVFYQQLTRNAASAVVKGAEFQIGLKPWNGLDIYSNIGYLDVKYKTYSGTVCSNTNGVNADCSGIPFAYAPKWTVDVGASYTHEISGGGKVRLGINYNYKADYYTADAPVPSSLQRGFGLLGGSIGYTTPNDRLTVEAFGMNLTDKKYIANSVGVPGLLAVRVDGRPIEAGLRLTARFGE